MDHRLFLLPGHELYRIHTLYLPVRGGKRDAKGIAVSNMFDSTCRHLLGGRPICIGGEGE